MSALASVVIPAHNEATVIGRTLEALLADARPGEFEVVVVANGCTDSTIEVARGYSDRVMVVCLDEPSKVAALNAGDIHATVYPRVYLDADVVLSTDAARQLAFALTTPDPCVAAPAPDIALAGRGCVIRAFYRCWLRSPFMQPGVVGNGVYALNKSGRARFGAFPIITGDDQFVSALFGTRERLTLTTCSFSISPPKTLSDLVRVRTRVYYGNAELGSAREVNVKRPDDSTASVRNLIAKARSVRDATDLVVYLSVNTIAKVRAGFRRWTGGGRRWDRDESTRAS